MHRVDMVDLVILSNSQTGERLDSAKKSEDPPKSSTTKETTDASIGYQLKPRVALIGGYRYLRVDYVNEGFIFKTAMSGINVGAKFDF